MLVILSLMNAVASALTVSLDPIGVSGAYLRGKFCETRLVSKQSRFMAGYYFEENFPRSARLPVQIHDGGDGRRLEAIFFGLGSPFALDAGGFASPPRIVLGRDAIATGRGAGWQWTSGAPTNQIGLAARDFWTRHLVPLEKLMKDGHASLADVLGSELHALTWDGRSAFILRGEHGLDRLRPMWLFVDGVGEAQPISRLFEGLPLTQMFPVNDHVVYRIEDGEGILRYVFEKKGARR